MPSRLNTFRRKRKVKVFDHSHASKIGLPPGTPVHLGAQRDFTPYATLIQYHGQDYCEMKEIPPEQILTKLRPDMVNWVNVEGIHDVRMVQNICGALDIHPLTQEDIVNTQLRPQFDSYPGYFFFALKMLYLNDERQMIQEHVSLILKGNTVISFQETPGDVFGRIRDRIRSQTGVVRMRNADYLVYMLLDSIVDGYYQILDSLTERIEALEDDLRAKAKDSHLQRIYELKREVLFLRKNIFPVRDLLSKAQVEGNVFQDSKIYFKDLAAHIVQVTESLSLCTEMTSVLLDTFHSMMNQRMNGIMKTLTMMSTIFLPLNFIAGIYGMNFHHMPELDWTYGYPTALGAMCVVVVGMTIFFIKKGWLLENRREPPAKSC